MSSHIWLRPLTDDSLLSCDWGGCDGEATAERWLPDPENFGVHSDWLSVCKRHSGRNPNWVPKGSRWRLEVREGL